MRRRRRSPVEAANPYRLELEDVSRAIRTGSAPRLGRADALGQARAIEKLYAAAGCLSGGRVARAARAIAVDAGLLRRRRELRLLVVGQSISDLGSMITFVAIPVQTYQLTGSSLYVGLLGVAEFVPMLLLALVGGALADSFDRRRLVMIAEVGALLVVAGLVANSLLEEPQLWVLYVAAALIAACTAIRRPPLDALMPAPRRARRAQVGERAAVGDPQRRDDGRAGARRRPDRHRRRGGHVHGRPRRRSASRSPRWRRCGRRRRRRARRSGCKAIAEGCATPPRARS